MPTPRFAGVLLCCRTVERPTEEIHLPAPSYFPIIVALGIMVTAYGILYHTRPFGIPLIVLGVFVAIASFVGWGSEPLEEIHDEHPLDDAVIDDVVGAGVDD